jgi:PBSX family phage terminase large subunit
MIDWKPFSPKQRDFIEHSTAKMNIATGSVRSGKTIACSIRWIFYLMTGPQADYCMMGKSLGTLKRNVINDLFDILGKNNIKWVDRQQGELLILGKRVYAIGAATEEAEERIRGATFAGAYCDEANLYPESVWMQLQARLSIPGAKTFANCNPDSPYHWFYKNVLRNKTMDKKIWQFNMEDNLSLTDEYKRQLASQFSGVFKKRFIDGKWCVADGKIYDTFDPEKHVIDTSSIVNQLPEVDREYYIGCDQGTSVTCSWSIMCKDKKTGINYKIREYYYEAKEERRQKDDAQYFADFQRLLSETIPEKFLQKNRLPVYGDPAASSWDAMLTNHGYNFKHADNDVVEGIKFVLNLINTGKYYIDKSCKRTIEEYENYSWDEKAQEKGVDKPKKVFDHACDSDRYCLYTHNKNNASGIYRIRRL